MFLFEEYLCNLVNGKIKGPQATILRGCLYVLSLIYGLAVMFLARLHRIALLRFKAKVISVGNLTLGGTGKTTLVEYLALKLSAQGKRLAVLSRGYKRDLRRIGEIGDEPAMLQKKLPRVTVLADKNRISAGFQAIRDYAVDTLILDDGFQQWRIYKDLEIVTINAKDPFGNDRMLPAGFLREPLAALKRADIFVLTQVDLVANTQALTDKLMRINPRALIVESVHQPESLIRVDNPKEILEQGSFKNQPVAIFSGIGNPQGFEKCICALGAHVGLSLRFPDHHHYTQSDVDNILKAARDKNLHTVITTQKDAVKIAQLKIEGAKIWALDISLKITKNEAEFNRRLFKLYSL